MTRGTHGDKIVAAITSDKTPTNDKSRLLTALNVYVNWVTQLKTIDATTTDELIEKMVALLNDYKLYIDVDLIFDSPEDFLYRQKVQFTRDYTG